MVFRIIDNKKVEMTNDEWIMYENICRSYDDVNFKGSELFTGLFEVDDNGIIVFLRPPSTRKTSFEVFLFLMALMQNQHLRLMHKQVDELCAEIRNKIKE
jgi:hypothetical protein